MGRTIVGGFVAKNSGSVKDCYSVVSFNSPKDVSGGFVGVNTGRISTSFCTNRIRKVSGGFAGDGNVSSDSCYFFHDEKIGSKRLAKLKDKLSGQNAKEVTNNNQAEALGFDTNYVWKYTSDARILTFKNENWMYRPKKTEDYIEISTAEELLEFARGVNRGETKLRHANVRLLKNIDLGGKEWIPIGKNKMYTFEGVFDGCCHMVKNFVIKDKKLTERGFFGFNHGEIYNLSIDCMMKGSGICGGVAAQNLNGKIGCCSSIVHISGKKPGAMIGGVVGINSGVVFQCYSAGRFDFFNVPTGPLVACIATVTVFGAVGSIGSSLSDRPFFNPLLMDKNQVAIHDDEYAGDGNSDIDTTESITNTLSIMMNMDIDVDLATGKCYINYKNPEESTNNVVLELKLSEDDEESLARCNAIAPGFQMDTLDLSQHAISRLKKGDMDAIVCMIPYDVDTNNRAMIQTQLPVVLHVQ